MEHPVRIAHSNADHPVERSWRAGFTWTPRAALRRLWCVIEVFAEGGADLTCGVKKNGHPAPESAPRYDLGMPLPPPRVTHLQDELVTQAAELLRKNTRESRLAAMQLLARGYAIDEQKRLAALGEPAGEE